MHCTGFRDVNEVPRSGRSRGRASTNGFSGRALAADRISPRARRAGCVARWVPCATVGQPVATRAVTANRISRRTPALKRPHQDRFCGPTTAGRSVLGPKAGPKVGEVIVRPRWSPAAIGLASLAPVSPIRYSVVFPWAVSPPRCSTAKGWPTTRAPASPLRAGTRKRCLHRDPVPGSREGECSDALALHERRCRNPRATLWPISRQELQSGCIGRACRAGRSARRVGPPGPYSWKPPSRA